MMDLEKALYIVINDFLGKLYFSFFIIDISLLTLETALSIRSLKYDFCQVLNQDVFDKTLFSLEYC